MPETSSAFCAGRLLGTLKAVAQRVPIIRLDEAGKCAGLVLRMDVDFSLTAAERMGRSLAEAGLVASFFVLTSSPQYNVVARESVRRLKNIEAMGCEIGLHFDPTVGAGVGTQFDGKSLEQLRAARDWELLLLSDLLGHRVSSYSLHNPSLTGWLDLGEQEGLSSSYHRDFFSPELYRSDSRMVFPADLDSWVSAFEAQLASLGRGHRQLLLHPEHYTESGLKYDGIAMAVTQDFASSLWSTLSVNGEFVRALPIPPRVTFS